MISGGMRRILFVIGAGILLLIVLEAGVYNWRLVLSMRHKNLAELSKQLSWRRDELLVERAALLNPERLQQVGTQLGLQPVPLERFSICRLDEGEAGGDTHVCLEQ
ncbi:MAG: hypothetical protein GF388_10370 [Candidatus Aegiribacteria sp.]|nr:hypothetical protein [Candidatus Aegiribacteria sp.]MBD3295429.1 hypothetical protein [Candidatus Fermentibacteria bacterium]